MTPEEVVTVRRVIESAWGSSLSEDDLKELVSRVLLAIVEHREGIRDLRAYTYVVARRALRAVQQERGREAETLAVIAFSSLRPGVDRLPAHIEVPSERSNWGGRRPGAGRPPKLRLVR